MAGSTTSGDVKVLSSLMSLFGLRVVMALKEKGVEYEYEEQDLRNKSQLLLESNPVHKKVPVLIHRGHPICESLLILHYIDETWPSSPPQSADFLPQDPYKRALVRFWADFVDKKVYDGCILILKNVEGELMEQGRTILKESLLTLDGAMQDVFGGGPYFGGDHINLLDIALASHLPLFGTFKALANFKVLDERICPHIYAWANVVVQHSSVKESLATLPSDDKLLESVHWMRKNVFSLNE